MITISAPAKINLTLEVLGNRPDGYHEVRSIMQSISLSDTLIIKEADTLEITSDDEQWDGRISLVAKAADLLKKRTGTRKGASIIVQKRIPLLSGLGGDSSDAAAALAGLNEIWSLGLSRDELKKMANELGSDIPFFFSGGTALATGRGEIISSLPPISHSWVVLIFPDTPRRPRKTKTAYESLIPSHFTDGDTTNQLVDSLITGKYPDDTLLINAFEKVAFSLYPGLETIQQQLSSIGISSFHLAGSGPTLFSHSWVVLIFPDTPRLPRKTKTAYESLIPSHFTNGNTTNQLVDSLIAGKYPDDTLLINAFEKVAFSLYPGLETIQQQLSSIGISSFHLAGSGPTLFSIYGDLVKAKDIISRLEDHNIQCYLTETT